jgi:hypothetical protein
MHQGSRSTGNWGLSENGELDILTFTGTTILSKNLNFELYGI